MVCGAEMRVMQVVPDETMAVPGYEHHTLQCSECGDVETRLVFSREKTPVDSVAVPSATLAAPESPPERERVAEEPKPEGERVAAPSAWARAVALFRGRPAGKGS
jgi:hypothetical protein